MSLSQWGASGSYLFLASELILAAATLSKAHEADSVGPGCVRQKTLVSKRNQLSGGISPVWIWACAFKPQFGCIISETSVLGGAGEARKWLWSHQSFRRQRPNSGFLEGSWGDAWWGQVPAVCGEGGVFLFSCPFLPGYC